MQCRQAQSVSGQDKSLTFHVFAGLCGGTGSGSVVDTMVQLRKHYPDSKIVVYAMMPETIPPGGCDAGRYFENGYAALREINAVQTLKYIPYDITGNDGSRMPFSPDLRNVVNGVIVYSNTNENGAVVHSFDELPQLVSNFVYYRIFLEYNDKTTGDFIRSYSFENIDDYDCEYDEKSKDKGSYNRLRSKYFSSFGIKRIIYPENKIIDNISYTIGFQSLLQFKYNNWSDGYGFSNEPSNKDFHSYISDVKQLESWRMTDDYLMLSMPLLETDKGSWTNFREYWDAVIPVLSEEAKSKDQPLHVLAGYCAERYTKNFRKVGVDQFFESKTKAIKEHSAEIKKHVEKFLFTQWSEGELSLSDLTKIVDLLLDEVNVRKGNFESKKKSKSEEIDKVKGLKDLNEVTWSNLGVLERAMGKSSRIFGEQITVLRNYYIKQTEYRGIIFAIELLTRLRADIEILRTEISEFASVISDVLDISEKKISSTKLIEKNLKDTQDPLIEICESQRISDFQKGIMSDKRYMSQVTGKIRSSIIEKIGAYKTFNNVVENITKDEILDVFDTVLRDQITVLHDEICVKHSEQILGLSVLQQLEKVLNNEDSIKQFARDVVEKSGVYIKYDQSEIICSVPNNIPAVPGVNVFKKIVLITLPSPEGNDRLKIFTEKLKDAICNSVTGGVEVKVDSSGRRKDEITIASIVYCFPLRIIKDMPMLKTRYEKMVNDQSEDKAKESRVILHTEGDGNNLPDIFLAKAKPMAELQKEFMPYFILAYALGYIKYADKMDGTGKQAYGTIEKDELDMEVLAPLSDRFIDIEDSEFFNEDLCESIRDNVNNALQNDYLHVSRREELMSAVKNSIQNPILKECNNNTGSAEFLKFRERALNALNIIKTA